MKRIIILMVLVVFCMSFVSAPPPGLPPTITKQELLNLLTPELIDYYSDGVNEDYSTDDLDKALDTYFETPTGGDVPTADLPQDFKTACVSPCGNPGTCGSTTFGQAKCCSLSIARDAGDNYDECRDQCRATFTTNNAFEHCKTQCEEDRYCQDQCDSGYSCQSHADFGSTPICLTTGGGGGGGGTTDGTIPSGQSALECSSTIGNSINCEVYCGGKGYCGDDGVCSCNDIGCASCWSSGTTSCEQTCQQALGSNRASGYCDWFGTSQGNINACGGSSGIDCGPDEHCCACVQDYYPADGGDGDGSDGDGSGECGTSCGSTTVGKAVCCGPQSREGFTGDANAFCRSKDDLGCASNAVCQYNSDFSQPICINPGGGGGGDTTKTCGQLAVDAGASSQPSQSGGECRSSACDSTQRDLGISHNPDGTQECAHCCIPESSIDPAQINSCGRIGESLGFVQSQLKCIARGKNCNEYPGYIDVTTMTSLIPSDCDSGQGKCCARGALWGAMCRGDNNVITARCAEGLECVHKSGKYYSLCEFSGTCNANLCPENKPFCPPGGVGTRCVECRTNSDCRDKYPGMPRGCNENYQCGN